VGATGDALRMLTGEWSSNEGLIAWHPDDEERWYFTAAACEEAARTASGGFHVDGFDELNR
jgi:hypothetical protein